MIEREIEVKYMLTSASFDALKQQFFAEVPCRKQANHYFDTPDYQITKIQHAMLRIREKEDHAVLTLKRAAPSGEGLLEYHQEYFKWDHQHNTLTVDPGTVLTQLQLMNIPMNELYHLTTLVTYRYELSYQGGLLCLDENHYNGTIDYEIECEHESLAQANQLLDQILAHVYPTPRRSSLNKVQRAIYSISK